VSRPEASGGLRGVVPPGLHLRHAGAAEGRLRLPAGNVGTEHMFVKPAGW